MNRLRILTLALAAAGLSACTTLAPDYVRPAAPVAATWNAPATGGEAAIDADSPWAEVFTDARLRQVIERALEHNRNLRVAVLNIEKARAQYRIQRADLFPSLGLTANQNAQRVPESVSTTGETVISRQYGVNVGIASWELDLFGRVRSLRDAALEQYLATEEAQRATRLGVVAEVATAWLQLAADRENLALAERTLETRRKTLELVQASFDVGASSRLELRQAESAAETARANVASYTALAARALNALNLLAGDQIPAEWLPERLDAQATRLAELPAGLPAEVLVRRPDVVSAEHALRAANANIGAARAAFFPTISLTATTGSVSPELSGLFDGGTRAWTFIPQLTLPIFQAGRLAASLDVAEVSRDIAVAQYENTIQTAFREVADALADRANADETLDAQRKAVEAAQDSYRLSEARYEAGVDSFLTLLDAQRTLYSAELQLISARLAEAGNRIAVYKALGGGWH
ncbi:AdeC/AdeK/OprM family multidrug efflux complex outer membrane factor [Pseudothauera nasutitermitis]|uniref:AdeC/AdeK/OprM family multidrug efflux complex outer membrane factor n=1 Tax=Pseudothauera nasutitermitis TaxID=2565930 RepID=A0A4S4AZ30_9RHOO|nr:AdeC/AdeK/OprM family multidrug efflux complex outer membrane factor [Pseudothauera nasutitermitis]THF64621.1 AdeC/AdeK/OprM family multidrug efflux complex outer membrane factor [Pseudothauera nasutitermitis]